MMTSKNPIRLLLSGPITVLASLLLMSGTTLAPMDADAQLRRPPATTAKSATRRKPSGSRSRYSTRVTPRKAGENTSKQTTRNSGEQSALGDTRRYGMRLPRSPIQPQNDSATGRDTRRDGVRLTGSPVTSWSGWNRAMNRQAAAATPRQVQRTSRSGMRVTFRSAGRRRR